MDGNGNSTQSAIPWGVTALLYDATIVMDGIACTAAGDDLVQSSGGVSTPFRRRLLLGILLLNLLVGIIAGLALYRSYADRQDDAIRATQNFAHLLAHDL